ncbi:hypothetical protein Golomagni_05069 [Golovinomyces magnicellulatus]|nr:hypothetical protein Golomagni_05069 [Golovinomyces magnicellulatus]
MFKDLCLERANVFDGIRERVFEVLNWCERCLTRYGNAGYEILKGIEARGSYFSSDGASQRLTRILKRKELNFDPLVSNYSFDQLINILNKCEMLQTIVQIFGLQKITGHPLTYLRVGGTSAAQLASEVKSISYTAALDLQGFIHKTNRWPDLHFPMKYRQGNRLFQLYSLRVRNISKSDYNLSDWTHVRFNKNLEFDYHDNYLELMDDKSISF